MARPFFLAGCKYSPHPLFRRATLPASGRASVARALPIYINPMASNPNYVKKQLAVDTVSWTAIVAPIDCMGLAIKNSVLVDMKIRTDSADATTQDTIPAGSVETISAPRHA